MNAKIKIAVFSVFAVGAITVLLFSGATSGAALNSALMGTASMAEVDWIDWTWLAVLLWMWLTELTMLGLGAWLLWVTFSDNKNARLSDVNDERPFVPHDLDSSHSEKSEDGIFMRSRRP